MSDLIDREKFIYTLIFSEKTKSIFVKDLRSVIEVANEMPSEKPERKIIYCKDCRFAHLTTKGEMKYCDVWFPETKTDLSADDFCSSAEKRGE